MTCAPHHSLHGHMRKDPGGASMMVLPGDRMFQAQRIVPGKCRPVILHGYGVLKKLYGTLIDITFALVPLTDHEEQFLLSMWRRHPTAELPIFFAVNDWLMLKKDIPRDKGPDASNSPHSPAEASWTENPAADLFALGFLFGCWFFFPVLKLPRLFV